MLHVQHFLHVTSISNRLCLRSILGRYINYNIAHALCCIGDLCGENEESSPGVLCAKCVHDI